jgi:hypothetical protein
MTGPERDEENHRQRERNADALVRELADAIEQHEQVPEWVAALGRSSFDLHNLDMELAQLDRGEPAAAGATRSGGQAELLSFDAEELSLEIEITGSGPDRRLIGELEPPGPARIEIRQPSASSNWVQADDRGRFDAPLAPGPVSVVCHRPGRRPTATEWV